jgi:hypothetical protein
VAARRLRKYGPLQRHLERRQGRPEMMAFEEIEALIGKTLPPSATSSSFWANDNQDRARAWTRAGYRVAYVNRDEKVVRFERVR